MAAAGCGGFHLFHRITEKSLEIAREVDYIYSGSIRKGGLPTLRIVPTMLILLAAGGLILSCSSGSEGKKTEQDLYTEAQNCSERGEFESAIQTYERILKLYPDSPRTYKAQFLIGFVYSENLKDRQKAKENYQRVIDKYPDCDLADDARYMIKILETGTEPMISDTSTSSSD
jgi:tetratricopeptide (TPR) repeat protein